MRGTKRPQRVNLLQRSRRGGGASAENEIDTLLQALKRSNSHSSALAFQFPLQALKRSSSRLKLLVYYRALQDESLGEATIRLCDRQIEPVHIGNALANGKPQTASAFRR